MPQAPNASADDRKVLPLTTSLPGVAIAASAAPGDLVPGSRNEVWLCQCYSNGAGLLLYVKPALSLRRMMVEVLAAQVARCLRLPCPAPYLVTLKPHHVGRPKGAPGLIAFGSEAAGTSAVARPVRDVELMLEMLDKLRLTEAAFVLDEWIANGVRGPRDLLFDPVSGAAIIDHEGAMEPGTPPDAAVSNWLAQRVLERTPEKQRSALLRTLRARAAAAHRARLDEAPGEVQFLQDGLRVYEELALFLAQRLAHLDALLSQRVLPEQRTLA